MPLYYLYSDYWEYVYLPNNLLCAMTSSCMPCITHVFTINI